MGPVPPLKTQNKSEHPHSMILFFSTPQKARKYSECTHRIRTSRSPDPYLNKRERPCIDQGYARKSPAIIDLKTDSSSQAGGSSYRWALNGMLSAKTKTRTMKRLWLVRGDTSVGEIKKLSRLFQAIPALGFHGNEMTALQQQR